MSVRSKIKRVSGHVRKHFPASGVYLVTKIHRSSCRTVGIQSDNVEIRFPESSGHIGYKEHVFTIRTHSRMSARIFRIIKIQCFNIRQFISFNRSFHNFDVGRTFLICLNVVLFCQLVSRKINRL
ncbi:hypothetical protein D3C80_1318780 [compost metagenome]